jgi:hypothetical protein
MASRTLALAGKDEEAKADAPRRLVVELGRRAASDLAWLVAEEDVNKTTAVNRAVQVYRLLVEAQRNGGSVMVSDPVRGDSIMHIVT